MVKVNVTMSIDYSTYSALKEKKINVSGVCNNLLLDFLKRKNLETPGPLPKEPAPESLPDEEKMPEEDIPAGEQLGEQRQDGSVLIGKEARGLPQKPNEFISPEA